MRYFFVILFACLSTGGSRTTHASIYTKSLWNLTVRLKVILSPMSTSALLSRVGAVREPPIYRLTVSVTTKRDAAFA